MDSLSLSYFLKTREKAGIANFATRISPVARNGTITTNESASFPPMINAMIIEKVSSSGERTAMRIVNMNAICTLVTSVVILVTSDVDEKLSIFSNEKVCILLKISCLKFFAKPADAFALI